MDWSFGARRLRERGILGMNRRNAECINDQNPRRLFPIVDDKLRMHDLCDRIGVPSPKIFSVISRHSQLRDWEENWNGSGEFVVKPNRGSGGRGVLVVVGREETSFVRHNGERLNRGELRQHLSDILSGMYSLGGRPDVALLQQRVRLHPVFEAISFQGIPDIRVIAYRNDPAMAMLRLPTRESNGRANLHQGGLGVGVELETGTTCHAVQKNRFVDRHPDTGASLVG